MKNLFIITILVCFLSIQLIEGQICQCPQQQQEYSITLHQCLNQPQNENDQGYLRSCQNYILDQQSGQWVCQSCKPSYYYHKVTYSFSEHLVCSPTKIDNCIRFYERAKFDDHGHSLGYDLICLECQQGYYVQDADQCLENPQYGDESYIENCDKYFDNYGEEQPLCQYCSYGFHTDDNFKWCISNKGNKQLTPLCLKYENLDCKECKQGYYIDQNNKSKCLQASEIINNCALIKFNKYDKKNICQQCQQGYYTANNNSKCVKNPQKGSSNYQENCVSYKDHWKYNYPICAQCANDYGLDKNDFDSKCEQIRYYEEIDNCEAYEYKYFSDVRMHRYTCIQCKKGYAPLLYPYIDTQYIGKCILCPSNSVNWEQQNL